jgi:hypothetical protein
VGNGACGADACLINCPVVDACIADACLVDLLPIVPGISVPGSSGVPVSFSGCDKSENILFGEDLVKTFDILENLIKD